MYDQDQDVSEFVFDPTRALRELHRLHDRRECLARELSQLEQRAGVLRLGLIANSFVESEGAR
jgi:hypothetical protein